MVRSWAYILMIAATLAGVVALVWPSPEVQVIEEIAMPARAPAPRAEAPQKPAKAAANKAPQAAKKEAAPVPAVVKDMPAPNTTTKRQYAKPDNGMQPSPFSRTGSEGAKPAEPARPPSSHGAPPRPPMPFKPGTTPGSHQPAAK